MTQDIWIFSILFTFVFDTANKTFTVLHRSKSMSYTNFDKMFIIEIQQVSLIEYINIDQFNHLKIGKHFDSLK